MARTFQIKRGAKANMPTLAQGEFGFVTDSGAEELYIGNGSENIQIARQDEMPGLATATEAGLVTVDGTAGVGVNTENGNLFIKQATESDIDDKQHSYKPITPENLDYAVKAGIVNNANALTDDEKAAALEWLGVSAINPEFNLSSHQIANATYLGENITEGAENDTVEFWADKQSGRAWFSTEGMLIDQPSQYGFLINHTYAADVFQIFRSQSGGPTYWRSGNQEGWDGTWAQVPVLNENGELIIDGNVKGIYTIGEWLQTTADTHRSEAAEKYAVLDGSGWIYHRTPDEVRSDIGAAPAGYGLGTTATGVNVDTILSNLSQNGWYYWGNWLTDPDKPFASGSLLNNVRSEGYGCQIAFDASSQSVKMRNIINGAVGEWNDIYHTGNKPTAADVGAAPAGYGLGEVRGKIVADPKTISVSGYYYINSANAVNCPTLIPNYPYGAIHSVVRGTQVSLHFVFDRYHAYMYWDGDATNAVWEYLNPPMNPNTEYRTTERIGTKAVYKRNNNGVIEYRLDGETEWKPYAQAVGALATDGSNAMTSSLVFGSGYGAVNAMKNLSQLEVRTVANDMSNRRVLRILSSSGTSLVSNALKFFDIVNGEQTEYDILHSGNVGSYAAPAGFGLGVMPKKLTSADDMNDVWQSGWYFFLHTDVPANAESVAWVNLVRVDGYYNTVYKQTVYGMESNGAAAFGQNRTITRQRYNDGYTPWEWDNPPMELGVEYRTTERINGKAVYKRNNNGIIEYRLDGETTWKNEATIVGAVEGTSYSGDINALITNGHYRLSGSNANMPTWAAYGHCIVSRGHGSSDTVAQTLYGYNNSKMAYRGAQIMTDGSIKWQSWSEVYSTGNKPTAADVGAAPSSHNQTASTITAGTLAGKVVANATAMAETGQSQVRNIYATTTDLTAGSSSLATGSICFVYE